MVNRSKIKGTSAETAVVGYLRQHGAPHAERRALNGVNDRGDIAGIIGVCIEVKNHSRDNLPTWIDETVIEGVNDHAQIAVCWHKRRGTTDPGKWFVTMTGEQLIAVLRLTGHLPPETP